MMLERLVMLGVVLMVCIVGLVAWRALLARRTQGLVQQTVPDEVAQQLPAGPALLYFTTPTCAQCRLQQAPILAQLAQNTDVAVYTLDAIEQEPLARFFGVMTVPTTVWLDAQQHPSAINHGLAKLPKLRQQAATLLVQS